MTARTSGYSRSVYEHHQKIDETKTVEDRVKIKRTKNAQRKLGIENGSKTILIPRPNPDALQYLFGKRVASRAKARITELTQKHRKEQKRLKFKKAETQNDIMATQQNKKRIIKILINK